MERFCSNSKRLSAIFSKSFIIDLRLGFKYASEKIETFKMKLRLAKSSQLLQPSTIITKRSILDAAAVLDPSLTRKVSVNLERPDVGFCKNKFVSPTFFVNIW